MTVYAGATTAVASHAHPRDTPRRLANARAMEKKFREFFSPCRGATSDRWRRQR